MSNILKKANRKLKALGLGGRIEESKVKNKRFVWISPEGKRVNFGLKGAFTFFDGAPESKKKSYQARHSKIKLKDGTLAYKKPGTPAFLSWHVLW